MSQLTEAPVAHQLLAVVEISQPPRSPEVHDVECVDTGSTESKGLGSGRDVRYWILVTISSAALVVSFISSSLLGRFYFTGGGKSIWLYTLTQSAAFPLPGCILLALHFQSNQPFLNKFNISIRALLMYIAFGALSAMDNLFYSWSVSYLPISTVGLLGSTHLAFTAFFAFGLVQKRLTPFSTNTVVVVTLSACLLGLNTNSDKPHGLSEGKYIVGFVMALLANMIYGLLFPLMELALRKLSKEDDGRSHIVKSSQKTNDQNVIRNQVLKSELFLLLEMQTFTSIFATFFVLVGLISSSASGDFKALHHEMIAFDGSEWIYWIVLVSGAIGWQLTFLATLGVITLTSSLFAGVLASSNLPFLSLCGVLFFHDHFGGIKATAMALSLWGFTSYLYGGYIDASSL